MKLKRRTEDLLVELLAWVLAIALFASVGWCVRERAVILPKLFAHPNAQR